MASKRTALIVFLVAISETVSWTVDLPDIRKFIFEKYANVKHDEEIVSDGRKFYSNIEDNSMHHLEPDKYDNYANEYGYVSYMEKKVNGIVRNGTNYLEGLRRAIERYTQFVESCNNRNNSMSRNLTTWQPRMDSPPSMPDGQNMTTNFSISNPPSFNFSQPSFNFSEPSSPGFNFSMPRTSFDASNMSVTCEEVNERTEHVRRLAQLAMWSTMRLQDLAYARKYQKIDEYEENELILKLAWFLDRLAYLTGYEPEPQKFLPSFTQRPTTVSPTPVTLVPAPEPVMSAMINCLKENSSIPATERCRYPLPIPDVVRRITNTSGDSTSSSTESMGVLPMPTSSNLPQQSLELLITSDDNPFRNYPPFSRSKRHIDSKNEHNVIKSPSNHFTCVEYFKNHLSDSKSVVKSVKKTILKPYNREPAKGRKISIIKSKKSTILTPFHNIKYLTKLPMDSKKNIYSKKLHKIRVKTDKKSSIEHLNRLSSAKKTNFKSFNDVNIKNIKKRSTDDPMSKLMNYYIKYKVWDGSNPLNNKKNEFDRMTPQYDVQNYLTPKKHVAKRSLFNKDGHLHILTPLKNLHSFIKHKQRTHYHTYVIQKPKIISHLETIRHQINLNKIGKVDVKPKNIRKRSLYYENVYLPRESENPMRDISFYVKNKDGTDYNPSLVQAAQVRLGLEQVFQTGNIEVVRRYGSNYNPADPAPFYTGLLRSLADS